jgi:choline dehydrogenase-like flavoprotein
MSSYAVIRSGAGGGTLVSRLAPSGKRILLLERGDWLAREPHNWSAADVFMDNRYISADTWYDAETAKAFQPQVHYFVGGATKLCSTPAIEWSPRSTRGSRRRWPTTSKRLA